MKILKIEMKGLPNFTSALSLDFTARQRVSDNSKEQLFKLFSNSNTEIYNNKVISLIGINASGKTTILKAVSFAISLLNNEAINNIPSKDILKDMNADQIATVTLYFYNSSLFYKLETVIKKQINHTNDNERLVIVDEKLWSKNIKAIKTKKTLYEFKETDLKLQRDIKEQFLPDDVSIMIAENRKNNSSLLLRDMSVITNHNLLRVLGIFPQELLTFLDSSIEYLRGEVNEKNIDIRLKFWNKEEIIISNPHVLEKYLSSGTIKGLNIFMNAVLTFDAGGYLIVDEIENHFNQEIVATLVRFFIDKKVNRKGATLIFSTHYSELLDEFDRNDNIYIVRNKGGIMAENLSDILKRNDIKKSEAYNSGFLEGTVPQYESYIKLKKVLTSIRVED